MPCMSFASSSSFIFLLPCEFTRSPITSGRGSWCSGTERLGTEQHAAGRIERDLRDHRDRAADVGHRLARAEDLRAQLEQVLRGLRDDAVDAAFEQPLRLLAEDLDQLRGTDAAEI